MLEKVEEIFKSQHKILTFKKRACCAIWDTSGNVY